ncbi:MAG: hypothetical protein IJS44_01440 [Clostridia bacterium]|nr:hypothetical protein [Clostridia bacterium]
MKKYIAPALTVVETELENLILTSETDPKFNVSAEKSAGQTNWLDAWNSLL